MPRMTKERMIRRIKAMTDGFRVTSGSSVDEDEVTKIVKSFKGKLWGANSIQEKSFADMLSIITSLDVKGKYDSVTTVNTSGYPKFCKPLVCVIPTNINNNGHNYGANPVVLEGVNNPIALRKDGSMGNSLPIASDGIRLATNEEIDTLSDAQVNRMIDLYSA